jgi:stage II sporulation protein D
MMKVARIHDDGVYEVEGHGFGHGVGMSQYGAQYRAAEYNQTVDQILKFYYSGIEIIRLNLEAVF